MSTPTCRIHSQHSKSLYIRNRFTKQLGTIYCPHLPAAHTHTHNRPSANAAQNGLGRQVKLLQGQSPNKHCNPHVCYVIPCRNFYALFVYQYCKYTSTSVIIIFGLILLRFYYDWKFIVYQFSSLQSVILTLCFRYIPV